MKIEESIFLPFFRVAKKSKNEGMPISGKSVILAPGLQWGTIGGTINQYNWLSKLPAASRRSGPGGGGPLVSTCHPKLGPTT